MSITTKKRPTYLSEEASLGVLSASRNLWILLYHNFFKFGLILILPTNAEFKRLENE